MFPYLLTRPNRLRLARAFAKVPIVDISIACAVEDQMGQAWVDSPADPQFWMIDQTQFFCYLAGDFSTDAGCDFLSQIPGGRLLMAGSHGWQEAAQSAFGDRLIPVKRWRYSSESLSLEHLRKLASDNANTPNVRPVDTTLAGAGSPYLDIGAFDSANDFVQRGIGFCLMKDDATIGCAYSSLVCSSAIEVSIVVNPNHHRQGIATALSCQLLRWCLEHQLAPHWDAANQESCGLAEKLGYSRDGEYTAYYLK